MSTFYKERSNRKCHRLVKIKGVFLSGAQPYLAEFEKFCIYFYILDRVCVNVASCLVCKGKILLDHCVNGHKVTLSVRVHLLGNRNMYYKWSYKQPIAF